MFLTIEALATVGDYGFKFPYIAISIILGASIGTLLGRKGLSRVGLAGRNRLSIKTIILLLALVAAIVVPLVIYGITLGSNAQPILEANLILPITASFEATQVFLVLRWERTHRSHLYNSGVRMRAV